MKTKLLFLHPKRRRINKSKEEVIEKLRKVGLIGEEKKEKRRFRNLRISDTLRGLIEVIADAYYSRNSAILFNAVFGRIAKRCPGLYRKMARNLEMASIKMLAETYFSMAIGMSFLAGISSLLIVYTVVSVLTITGLKSVLLFLFALVGAPLITFLLFYFYPINKISKMRSSIDANLTFALSHMAAITTSGVPPAKAFEMLSEFTEYGGVSEESRRIVERVKIFGEDITTAIRYVARRTPSQKLKEFLFGTLAIIESGGNLKEYLNEMAERALFIYRLERKKYIENLSTFADMYTALLIIAPLLMVTVFAIMSVLPSKGGLFGLDLITLMKLGIYFVLPSVNFIFLLMLSVYQPEI